MAMVELMNDVNALLDGKIRNVSQTVRINAAANTIRQIGETIVAYFLKERGLWQEACTEKDGTIHTEEDYRPNYGYMISIADRQKVLKRDELQRLRVIQGYGNNGSHSGQSNINESDIRGLAQWLETVFFVDHPEVAIVEQIKDVNALLDGGYGVSQTVCINAAANTIRQIGETIVAYFLKEKGLWQEACTEKDGTIHTEEDYRPNYGYMISIADRQKVLKRDELQRLRVIQGYGNNGSHSGQSNINESDIRGLAQWLETIFFVDHPEVTIVCDANSSQPTAVTIQPIGRSGTKKEPSGAGTILAPLGGKIVPIREPAGGKKQPQDEGKKKHLNADSTKPILSVSRIKAQLARDRSKSQEELKEKYKEILKKIHDED